MGCDGSGSRATKRPFSTTAIEPQRETHIVLSLSEGDAKVRFWSSDLTVEYVKFNADYST